MRTISSAWQNYFGLAGSHNEIERAALRRRCCKWKLAAYLIGGFNT